MRRIITLALFAALLLTLFACNNNDAAEGNPSASPPEETSTPDPTETPEIGAEVPTPTPVDHTGGLPRGVDGILIGSAVLEEPVLLMGMGVDPVVIINVRDGPSLEANRLTTIGRGEVVEATEIVDGWYSIRVFPDMESGYVRSDLLVAYNNPGADLGVYDDSGGPNIFSGNDPSGLRRGADGVLIGSVQFDGPRKLMGMGSDAMVIINVREAPDIDAPRVESEWGTVTIGKGQLVEAFGVEDGWYRVRVYPGMFDGYIRSDLLVPYDDSRQYLAADIQDFDTKMSPNEELIAPGPLVDVRTIIPDIEYNLVFATPDNFSGKTQYSRDIPLLQLGTAQKLKEAQELFKQDGYRIKLYDAYRPSSVSGRLFDVVPDSRYVARAGTSIHNRAAAVDMTLIDADGNELEMPSPVHTLNSTSHRDSKAMSDEAKANMNYMTDIMRQVGMTGILSTEWWHFGDSDSSDYLPLDIEFRDFIYHSP